MKTRYFSILAAAAALVLSTSCNDFLDKLPDERVDLNTPEQLRLLLGDGYPTSNYALVGEMSSDNIVDNNSPDERGIRYNLASYDGMDDQLFAWEDVDMSTGSDSPSNIWEGFYHGIAAANAVLEKIEQFEAQGRGEEVKAIKGEALMIRAYNHFILANVFCMPYRGPELSKNVQGLPYMKKPETTLINDYSRGNLADFYANIEKDLEEGLPLVNDLLYEVPKFHFNKAASHAFAARFYVFTRQYDKALVHANEALGGEGADVSIYMSKIWNQPQINTLDAWIRYYTNINDPRNFMIVATHSIAGRHMFCQRYSLNRDGKRGTVQGPGPTWVKCGYYNTRTLEEYTLHPCFASVGMYYRGKSEYGTFFGAVGGELFEYTDKVAGIGYAHMVRTEFTGEETLLCRAEAKFFLGDKEGAIADLKVWDDVRQDNARGDSRMIPMSEKALVDFYTSDPGYGIIKPIKIDEVCPSSKYQMTPELEPFIQAIQHLRRIETVHTGMRWFDIKRFGLEIKHVIGKDGDVHILKSLDPRYAIQIPTEAIAASFEPNVRIEKPASKPELITSARLN